MKIEDIIFYLKEIDKRMLVNSPHNIALQETIGILSKLIMEKDNDNRES